jgi:hypothetical protein
MIKLTKVVPSYLIFNVETIGDESTPPELFPSMDDFDAPSTYKDPVKIVEYKQREMAKAIAKMSLSPLTARIVCASFKTSDVPEILTFTAMNRENEHKLLENVAKMFSLYETKTMVGFNSKSFDIPMIAISLARHGIKVPFDFRVAINKYDSYLHIDLYQILTNFEMKRGKLSDWCARFSLPAPFGNGGMVDGWYRDKDESSIVRHCQSNIISTERLLLSLFEADMLWVAGTLQPSERTS